MSDQFLRKVGLVLISGSKGLDLSSMRIKFRTDQSDLTTPNNAIIRVYNLSDATAQEAQKEYQTVSLQAGYENGNYGVIFQGTIKQTRKGRESPTDTYLDILAADGDIEHNFGHVNKSIAAGATQKDILASVAQQMGLPQGYTPDLTPGALSRGKVMFGMGRDSLDDVAATTNTTWSIQNGQLQMVPLTSYVPGEAVVLNAQTGMIGLPQQTQGGIEIKALLNPKIKIASLVQIDSQSIQRAFLGGNLLFAEGRLETLPGLLPTVTDDGFYRVYVAEYVGDSRGAEWYVNMTCLALINNTPSASADSVAAYG